MGAHPSGKRGAAEEASVLLSIDDVRQRPTGRFRDRRRIAVGNPADQSVACGRTASVALRNARIAISRIALLCTFPPRGEELGGKSHRRAVRGDLDFSVKTPSASR